MEKESHVVVIFPHPDDESFGTAGSIKQFRSEGVPVTYLCGTSGEMGRNMGTPPFANRETLWEIREKELKDACDLLDIDYRMLGFRDKTIEFEHTAERRMNQANRPTVWAAAITNNFEEVLGEPDVIIPVEESLSFKIDAILKHQSQAGGMLEKLRDTPEGMEEYIEGFKKRLGKERFFIWDYDKVK